MRIVSSSWCLVVDIPTVDLSEVFLPTRKDSGISNVYQYRWASDSIGTMTWISPFHNQLITKGMFLSHFVKLGMQAWRVQKIQGKILCDDDPESVITREGSTQTYYACLQEKIGIPRVTAKVRQMYPEYFHQLQELRKWIDNQRTFYQNSVQGKKNPISDERIRLLVQAGFDFRTLKGKPVHFKGWNENLDRLKEFKERYSYEACFLWSCSLSRWTLIWLTYLTGMVIHE
jgi:hypothetical protein